MNPCCQVQDQLNTSEPTAPYIIGRELNLRKLPGWQWDLNQQHFEQLRPMTIKTCASTEMDKTANINIGLVKVHILSHFKKYNICSDLYFWGKSLAFPWALVKLCCYICILSKCDNCCWSQRLELWKLVNSRKKARQLLFVQTSVMAPLHIDWLLCTCRNLYDIVVINHKL